MVRIDSNTQAVIAGILVETKVLQVGKRGEDSRQVDIFVADGKVYKLTPVIEAPTGLTYAHDVVIRGQDVYSVHVSTSKERAEKLTKEPLDGPFGFPVAMEHSDLGWVAIKRAAELDRFVAASKEVKTRPVQISTPLYDRIREIAAKSDRTIKDVSDEIIANGLMVS